MSDLLLLLSPEQRRRIEPFFPRSRGLRRVDDRRVVSGIVYVIRHGLQWKDAPAGHGPPETLYNRFVRGAGSACSRASSRGLRPKVVRPSD